jgi:hypothetical protein
MRLLIGTERQMPAIYYKGTSFNEATTISVTMYLCVPHSSTFRTSSFSQCVYEFHAMLGINSDNFKMHQKMTECRSRGFGKAQAQYLNTGN